MSMDELFDPVAKLQRLLNKDTDKTYALGSKKKRNVSTKAAVNAHEKQLSKKLGGTRQPNSGATPKHKGDILLKGFLFDSKETKNNSIIVSGVDLTKIQHEASQAGKHPGLVLTINAPIGTASEWVCISLTIFTEMLAKLEEYKKSASTCTRDEK